MKDPSTQPRLSEFHPYLVNTEFTHLLHNIPCERTSVMDDAIGLSENSWDESIIPQIFRECYRDNEGKITRYVVKTR